jgi:type IV pilus assembly protein PilX
MNFKCNAARGAQRGIVLISSLLLLMVVTIIALSMFRSFGMQEKIAGNMREKQRALQAAVSAQEYAENWLSNGNSSTATVTCNSLLNANLGFGQICNLPLSQMVPGNDITVVPWLNGGAPIGVSYAPTGMSVSATTSFSAANVNNPTYWGTPTFYIADMGASVDPTIPGEIYQIDAVGYGGGATTAAIVESTYAVYTSSSNRTL